MPVSGFFRPHSILMLPQVGSDRARQCPSPSQRNSDHCLLSTSLPYAVLSCISSISCAPPSVRPSAPPPLSLRSSASPQRVCYEASLPHSPFPSLLTVVVSSPTVEHPSLRFLSLPPDISSTISQQSYAMRLTAPLCFSCLLRPSSLLLFLPAKRLFVQCCDYGQVETLLHDPLPYTA